MITHEDQPSAAKHPPGRILLVTDLSCRCDRALDRAIRLARAWQAELIVLHVIEGEDAPDLPAFRRGREARAELAERLIRSDIGGSGVRFDVAIERGRPADVILRKAAELCAGLIVTGIAREETLTRAILGTTVDRLVRWAPMPVLVVKNRAHRDYETMVVASDFSPSSKHATEQAAALFPEARTLLFHAYRVPFAGFLDNDLSRSEIREQAEQDCSNFFSRLALPPEALRNLKCRIEHGSADAVIGAYVWDNKVDLVAIGTHGRSGTFDVLVGSTAEILLSYLPCDMLVVREPRAVRSATPNAEPSSPEAGTRRPA